MHVTLVHVRVKPESIAEFIEASRRNHESSVLEEGNCRFDVLQDPEESAHFILYEAYADEAAAKGHKETEHYLKWRDTVSGMMSEPRQGVGYIGLFPQV